MNESTMRKNHCTHTTLLLIALLFAPGRDTASLSPPIQAGRPALPEALSLQTGDGPECVVSGDVNADGLLDLVTANVRSDSASVFLGDGRGNFRTAPGSPQAAGSRPHLLALGDFDSDAWIDLAVSEHDSHSVRVYRGLGDGRFRLPGSSFPVLGRGTPHNHGLTAADVNADGALDLITSNQNDKSVSVLLGDGRGNFRPAPGSPFAVGRDPYPHAVGDLNGDEKVDIAVPNVASGTLSVLMGDGRGGFASARAIPVLPRPYFVALADLNGDGKADLASSHDDTTRLTVLYGDGAGNFLAAPGSPFDAGARVVGFVAADVSGDQLPELVLAAGREIVMLARDTSGRFAVTKRLAAPGMRGVWNLTVADWNRDGKPDVAAPDSQTNTLHVFWGR